jgi:hypothetical protein
MQRGDASWTEYSPAVVMAATTPTATKPGHRPCRKGCSHLLPQADQDAADRIAALIER